MANRPPVKHHRDCSHVNVMKGYALEGGSYLFVLHIAS